MRFSLLLLSVLLLVSGLRADALPGELTTALETLRTDAPLGWAFTQTTLNGERRRVERYTARGPAPARWQLLEVDGRAPSERELEEYRKQQILRAGGGPAPNVKQQIDRATGEKISDDGTRAVWRFRLLAEQENDDWAEHMRAIFTLHRPTGSIERVELAAPEPFSPRFAVNVQEASTTMTYSLPGDGRPALLQEITVRIRGRAWYWRSLDSDLTVRYSDYAYVGPRAGVPAEEP